MGYYITVPSFYFGVFIDAEADVILFLYRYIYSFVHGIKTNFRRLPMTLIRLRRRRRGDSSRIALYGAPATEGGTQ